MKQLFWVSGAGGVLATFIWFFWWALPLWLQPYTPFLLNLGVVVSVVCMFAGLAIGAGLIRVQRR